jgi:hypothetical protein
MHEARQRASRGTGHALVGPVLQISKDLIGMEMLHDFTVCQGNALPLPAGSFSTAFAKAVCAAAIVESSDREYR